MDWSAPPAAINATALSQPAVLTIMTISNAIIKAALLVKLIIAAISL